MVSPVRNITTFVRAASLTDALIADLLNIKSWTFLELGLYGPEVAHISTISGLTNLTHLDLDYTEVSDFSATSGLTNLEGVSYCLNGTKAVTSHADTSACSGGSLNLNKLGYVLIFTF